MPQNKCENNDFLALNTLPNFKLVCPQTRNKQLKETKAINQRITNRQVLKMENKCMAQMKNGTHKANMLTTIHDDNIDTTQMLNTKTMPNILKQH